MARRKPTEQVVIHTVKGFGIVNKAEIDVFVELSCFFDNLADVGNLISGLGIPHAVEQLNLCTTTTEPVL